MLRPLATSAQGSLAELRANWIEKRLKPLYQGKNPLMAAHDVHGIRFVAIDNSNYEVLPDQLKFFHSQVSSGVPLVLLMHIPLYAPGRSASAVGIQSGVQNRIETMNWSVALNGQCRVIRRQH